MSNNGRPKVDDLIKRIHRSNGNISAVARYYGRPRSTVQYWIESSSTAMQAVEDSKNALVDTAIDVIYTAMQEMNLKAAMYTLNNSPEAKRRGWGPRQELVGNSSEPVIITMIRENRANKDD